MSKHFGTLKVGDSLDIKGPIVKLKYEPNMKRAIGMVAGGTGITPMLQVCAFSACAQPAPPTILDTLHFLRSFYPRRFATCIIIRVLVVLITY